MATPSPGPRPEALIEVDDPPSFDEHVLRSPLPVLVEFWASWCAPCKAMAPAIEHLGERHGDTIRFVRVNTESALEVAAACNVRSVPTIALFWRGELRDVLIGYKSEAELEKHLEWLLDLATGRGLIGRLWRRRKRS